MRRTLAAAPVSWVNRNRAICPVVGTCVPPHSSRETPGTSTTRTTSPYFSVKRAIAPAAIASWYFISRVCTGRFSQMCWFTSSSMLASTSPAIGPWWLKSKRRRSGATTDPCWHQLQTLSRLAKGDRLGLGAGRHVADPLLAALRLDGDPVAGGLGLEERPGPPPCPRRARAPPLRRERALEAVGVHRLAALGRDHLREVEREAVGVVQLERLLAGDDLRTLQFVQPREPALDGLEEAVLLGARHLLDVHALRAELGIDIGHRMDDRTGEVHQRRLTPAQQPGVADRPAQDAPH